MKNIFTLVILFAITTFGISQSKNVVKFLLDGHLRETIIVIPSKPAPKDGYPVVFMLHGTSGDGEKFYIQSGWKELGEQENFITVFPSSLSWCFVKDGVEEDNTRWVEGSVTENPCSGKPQNYVDDVKFLKIVAQKIIDSLPVNKSMIFLSGFSNGSGMMHKMAIEAGDVFAAVAGTSGMLSAIDSASPVKRIPIWFMVGTLDDRFFTAPSNSLPWGRDSILGYLRKPLTRILNCQGLTESFTYNETPITHSYIFDKSASGNNSQEYILTLISGMKHQYPNGTNFPIDGPKLFWNFFKQSVLTKTTSDERAKDILVAYPNPANQFLTIELDENVIQSHGELSISNINGNSIWLQKGYLKNKYVLSTSEIGSGCFILHFKSDKITYTKKLFIQ